MGNTVVPADIAVPQALLLISSYFCIMINKLPPLFLLFERRE